MISPQQYLEFRFHLASVEKMQETTDLYHVFLIFRAMTIALATISKIKYKKTNE